MEMEGSSRDLAFKIHLKQISIQRIKILITDPEKIEQVQFNTKSLKSSRCQKLYIAKHVNVFK